MSIKLLTYNTAMLPPLPIVKPEEGKERRAKRIAEKIIENNYDVVCLQEVFFEGAREIFIDILNGQYEYMVEKVSDDFLFFQDSGLFFASRIPFAGKKKKWDYILYEDKVDTDALSSKSLFGCRLDLPGNGEHKELFVFSTHLQSDKSYREIRFKQLQQANKAIYNFLISTRANTSYSNISAMLVGDLNIIGTPVDNNGSQSEYESMRDILDYPVDLYACKNEADPGYTWDGTKNKFVMQNDPDDKDRQRLDYALAFNSIPLINRDWSRISLRRINCLNANVVKFQSPDNIDLSDHYGLEVEIDF